jgi:hypothetical protein
VVVLNIRSDVAGDKIAFCCTVVILGIRNPCVVDVISNVADAFGLVVPKPMPVVELYRREFPRVVPLGVHLGIKFNVPLPDTLPPVPVSRYKAIAAAICGAVPVGNKN